MAGLQLSGLASGLDWRSLVDQLISAERVPQNRLRADRGTGLQTSSALDALKTNLTALQTSIAGLTGGDSEVFAVRTAKFASTDSAWSAGADPGAEVGTHTFDVTQLATRSQRVGTSGVGRGLSATADVSGLTFATLPIARPLTAGEFTVNGARVTVALTDSLDQLFQKISTATGGEVTASYDPAQDRVVLSGTGEIVLGSANDSSNALAALGLHNNGTNTTQSSQALGVVKTGTALVNANLDAAISGVDATGNGSFTINGVSISYNVNTDSLSAIFTRINESDAGVTASYDRLNDRFTFTNKTTGDSGLAVSEGPNGLLAALGLTTGAALSRGKDALVSVDGGPLLTSASNTFDASLHGITGLSVTAKSESTESVTIGADTTSIRGKIDDFIAKFNAVQKYIEAQTKTTTANDGTVTAATLASNREVTDISRSLRTKVFDAVPGLTGTIQRLESLGIDFKSGTNELELKDSAKLDAAIAAHGDEVRALFTKADTGLAARLNEYVTRVTGTSGTLATQMERIAKENKGIDEQNANMERHLAQQKSLLESSFIRMEEAQSKIQSQLAALTNAFGGSSSK
jgi:flagellar hook-associated protein 2